MQDGLLTLGLAASGWADACTPDALLRLPLEQLLRLNVALRLVSRNGGDAPEPVCLMADGERDAA